MTSCNFTHLIVQPEFVIKSIKSEWVLCEFGFMFVIFCHCEKLISKLSRFSWEKIQLSNLKKSASH